MSRQLPCDGCKGSGSKSGKRYECNVSTAIGVMDVARGVLHQPPQAEGA